MVPVRLDVDVDRRLPESTEAAAYYVIAEALTNTAKHAEASEVTVRAGFDGDELLLEVADDGIGGAATDGGTGLIGLKDRVEAVSGSIEITSPAHGGTLVVARIPVHPE